MLTPTALGPAEYFPRLSYWALLVSVDVFIVADTVPYSRQSFQNRTRVRNPNGWQWISIPLQARTPGTSITEARIDTQAPWTGKHRRALAFNYRTAPYFEYYEPDLNAFFDTTWTVLGDLTWGSVELVHRLLGLETELRRASLYNASGTTLRQIQAATPEAIWHITSDQQAAIDPGYPVQMWHFETPQYRQNFAGFEPGMSILDLIFNYGPEAVGLLKQHLHPVRQSS